MNLMTGERWDTAEGEGMGIILGEDDGGWEVLLHSLGRFASTSCTETLSVLRFTGSCTTKKRWRERDKEEGRE